MADDISKGGDGFAAAGRAREFPQEFVMTGPDTLGGRYLRQFWHAVSRSEDISPGRAKTIRILSEEFTLYRGEGGTAHVTQHRCPHRLTQLSVGYVEEDSIRCLYHGWKFGNDGRCTERPAEPGMLGGDIRIKTYPTQEFLGLIYTYFGEGEAPHFPPYPGFVGEGVLDVLVEPQLCNYFQGWENDWDLYHAYFTHRTGELHGPLTGNTRTEFFTTILETEVYEETESGIQRSFDMPGGARSETMLFMPASVRLMVPALNEVVRQGLGPTFRQMHLTHTPVDDESHIVFATTLVPGQDADAYKASFAKVLEARAKHPSPIEAAKEIFASQKNLNDFRDHPSLVVIEDMLAQSGQGAIVDRSQERLGRSDRGLLFLRRLWARELIALSEGRPTKAWKPLAEMPKGATVELRA